MIAVAMLAVLLCATGAGACLGSAVVARHRAQAAADLAALAGATRLPQGVAAACMWATTLVQKMSVGPTGCQVEGLDVVVSVEVPVAHIGVARAAARAGPVGTGTPTR